jgi:hypothetical protein
MWLLRKEWRELLASRSWWVMLALTGPLVGVSFISAVRAYGEASGVGGTAAGLADALWPLDGVLVPTLSAYEIVALFMLPFVAIRIVAGDRQSGALKLELQQPMSAMAMAGAKAMVLLAGWCLANIPAVIALGLWRIYGGSIYAPELSSILLGHLLNAGLIIALAAAAASISEHPSTAAILVLAFTVGTWVLNFVAAVQGGLWAQLAGYTPAEILQTFQHALIRLNLVFAALALIGAGLALSAIWMRLGVAVRTRAWETLAVVAAASALVFACPLVRADWDVSENQRNSFSGPETEVLEHIKMPLSIEVHLAPEDPRRFDLEHRTLSKLRRIMPKVIVRYVSSTAIGLFEQANTHYGELWYDLDGRRTMNRLTTSEGVLETIYRLAGVQPPTEDEPARHGHPLAVRPVGAAPLFYGVWPVTIAGLGLFLKRRIT